MSAAPVAALVPHFQCASSSSFPPVPSSDPLLLAASPVHGSCFACLRFGTPSPSPSGTKNPDQQSADRDHSVMEDSTEAWDVSLFRPTSLLRRISLRGTLSLRILSSLQSSFAASLLRFPFCCGPLLWLPLLRPLCGSPLLRPLFRGPLRGPPPGKGYFWNR